jgi:hypothetical protein
MKTHKFRIGQSVVYKHTKDAREGAYVIIARLPQRDGQFEYRLRHPHKLDQRSAKESELSTSRKRTYT